MIVKTMTLMMMMMMRFHKGDKYLVADGLRISNTVISQQTVVPDFLCSLCLQRTVDSFVQVEQECPWVFNFWAKIINIITNLTGVQSPLDPVVILLGYDSRCTLIDKTCKV